MIERYSLSPMKELWTEAAQYARWLEVELAVVEVFEETGDAPQGSAAVMRAKAVIDPDEIRRIEMETDHDVIAFIKSVTSRMGDEARYFHKGLTSSDVVDTAWSLAMKRAGELVLAEVDRMIEALRGLALRHKDTITVGRTHGMHAEPTSFGLKALSWLAEAERNRERVARATDGIAHGKISGAVGNYAHIPPQLEERVLAKLGLKPSKVSTQVVPRDHHAEWVSALALLGAGIERLATEVRHLQRTEVGEAMEPFRSGQRGSSAMPHKRNPILCERLCGLARLLRGHVATAYENIALWHERDISHSSADRVILPDAALAAHYMAQRTVGLVEGLVVDTERMRENFGASHNLVFSQRLLLALVDKGMSREEAYLLVQQRAMEAANSRRDFRALAGQDDRVRRLLAEDDLDRVFDGAAYLRHVGDVFQRFQLP
ncbi:MAG: adenylosuccinate lyase [Candidatus Sumerlaeia bacterium]|nr:adenylosuccinate lyase [Candidatus Sumerlaeia bacterium]